MSDKLNPEFFFDASNGQLSLTEAETFTRNWVETGTITANDFRAFSVRASELNALLELVNSNGLDAVRFYFGMKPRPDGKFGLKPCLVMAGVQGFEVDFSNPNDPVVTNAGKEIYFPDRKSNVEGEFVYDFSYPCPSTCQNDSPLMDPPQPAAANSY